MASDESASGFVAGRGYTPDDWDEVCDTPEITPEQWAKARPLAETRPELVVAMARGTTDRRSASGDIGAMQLDEDVLAKLRAGGSDWQGRANDILRRGLGLDVTRAG